MSNNEGSNCYGCIHAVRLTGGGEIWFRCTKFHTFLSEESERYIGKPSSWCPAGTPIPSLDDEEHIDGTQA